MPILKASQQKANCSKITNITAIKIRSQLWCGLSGEIDLVVSKEDILVLAEVKKSSTQVRTSGHVAQFRMSRIIESTQHFMACKNSPVNLGMGFDVALLNALGDMVIFENAFP